MITLNTLGNIKKKYNNQYDEIIVFARETNAYGDYTNYFVEETYYDDSDVADYKLCSTRHDIRTSENEIGIHDNTDSAEYFGYCYDDDGYIVDEDENPRSILFIVLQDYNHQEVDTTDSRLEIIDGTFEDTYCGTDIKVYVSDGYITKAMFPSGYKYLYKRHGHFSSWYSWEPSVKSYLEAVLNPDTDGFLWK